VTEAIFGLVGVVVGGLLTAGVSYVMARRQERADTRGAARLVSSELLRNYAHLAAVVQARRWHALARNRRTRFEEFEAVLSRRLPGADDRAVGSAYLALETVEMAAERANHDEEMSLEEWRTAVRALNDVRSGLDALINHTDMPSQGEDVAVPLGRHPALEHAEEPPAS
jgi:hypothetical protein